MARVCGYNTENQKITVQTKLFILPKITYDHFADKMVSKLELARRIQNICIFKNSPFFPIQPLLNVNVLFSPRN